MKPSSTKIQNARPKTILIPGETEWELWEIGGRPQKKASHPTLEGFKKVPPAIAIPVVHIQTFPLWIGTTEPTLVAEMLLLQLEKRGLTKLSDIHSENPPFLTVNREPTR
ncbi:MAG: hypothetical protein V4507_01220, partial [Verrucomicrobiota bacterium]